MAEVSVSSEKAGGCFSKFLWKLKLRAMPEIREQQEPGVGKLLLERMNELTVGTIMSS